MRRQTWQLGIVTLALVAAGWSTWAQTITEVFPGRVRILSTAAEALVVNGGVRITKAATTGGPDVIIDSSFAAGGDYMGSVLFQLDGVNIARLGSYEFAVDQYGIGFWTYPGGTATEALRIAQSGEITAVRQPGFLAYNSAADINQANNATVDFDAEVYDEAADFSADTFTAPITGRYQLCSTVQLIADNATSFVGHKIVTSNRTYTISSTLSDSIANLLSHSGCVFADLDTADTASVQVGSTNDLVDIQGGSSPLVTFFSGRLIP